MYGDSVQSLADTATLVTFILINSRHEKNGLKLIFGSVWGAGNLTDEVRPTPITRHTSGHESRALYFLLCVFVCAHACACTIPYHPPSSSSACLKPDIAVCAQ